MQDILIYIRDFTEHTPAAQYGLTLAARLGATATGVFVFPEPVIYAPAAYPELLARIMERARALEREALAAGPAFLEWSASSGVSQADWLVAQGTAVHALAQAATRHDLLVVDHAPLDDDPASDLSDIVLGVGIPCIVTPRNRQAHGQIERIAVGWNGSAEAARALRAALPLMRGKQVLLMTGEVRSTRSTLRGVTWKTPFDVADYLQRHNITVTHTSIAASPSDAGGALLEQAMEFNADLFVMGAYGRTRFSEWLLGGATRYALTRAEMPVLLQH